jgi:FtsH-binding integral membrane protein
LVFALIGLLVLSLMQLFLPAFRTSQMELLLSGAGVVIFAGFLTYDLQRIQAVSRYGVSPFLLALSLYLDIYNLFMYVLRLMTAISGDRR